MDSSIAGRQSKKLSLIVTTQGDRKNEFRRLLDSFDRQSNKDFQVIIVDQSETCDALEMAQERTFNHIDIALQRRASLSEARNIGLRCCNTPYVAFPDDDCWYPDDLVNVVLGILESGSAECVTCNCYDPLKKAYLSRRQAKKNVVNINEQNAIKYVMSIGIFCKYGPEVFFDEELGAGTKWGSGEESDLILRMLYAKRKIVYYKNIVVYHPCVSQIEDLDKIYRYGQGFGALLAKAVSRNQYACYYDYYVTLVRSGIAVLLYAIKGDSRKALYLARIRGMRNGFNTAKREFSQ